MTVIADPRLGLVTALIAIVAVAQLHGLPAATAAFILAAMLGGVTRAGWPLARRLVHVEGFMLLLFVMLPLTMPGEPLARIGPLSVSAEGIALAALVALKVSASVLLLAVLVGSMEPARLGATLHALHVPERFNRLLVMTARYVDLIRAEAQRLRESMRARGFRPRSNRHTWRSYGHLAGMVLIRALDRAERVTEAMRCRGFSGRYPHAAFAPPALRDWTASIAVAVTGLILLAADRL
ncbi:MAG: cobalt ECF transporter T component CbiQ [Bosea sp.]|nr:cobalt ECF transporter T component CbiQ [Bosea sp. (in: a-proteobacteria)]